MWTKMALLLLGSLVSAAVWSAQAVEDELVFRELYRELVETDTTLSNGSCTDAANAMATRLRSSGLPDSDIHVIVAQEWPTQGNLVATLRGSDQSRKAIILLAHIDVVEARREDWARDPFKLIEEDGYYYGRGTSDDKAMAAIFVDILMRMSQSGYQPQQSLKLVLSCGEETYNTFNGVSYLLEHHRELVDAEFAINEGGGGRLDSDGRHLFLAVQAGEKTYQDFRLEVVNTGGHSSQPRSDNAIYSLSSALKRISEYNFPVEFNGTTRTYFERLSAMGAGREADDMLAILRSPPATDALERILTNPGYNSVLHTTCVATMLDAGHAPNALPQNASANVNCRIFPGHTQEEILQILEQLVDDPEVVVSLADAPELTSPPPVLTPKILGPIEMLSEQMWPGVPVIPTMIAGATDGRFFTPRGIPTYGVNGIFRMAGSSNIHGLNEKMRITSLFEGREFLERLIKIYAE